MKVPTLSAMLLAGAGALVPQLPPPPMEAEAVVHGRVVDAQTGRPIAAAQVEIVGTNRGDITNDDGYYAIDDVPAGLVDIRAVSIGYRAQVVNDQRILAGQTHTQNFSLSPSPVEIEAIVVEGERSPLVPRDQVSSRAIVTGETADALSRGNAWDREGYAHIAENAFVSPASVPLSTFGVDVDRASYANVRRFLRDGRLPPAGAVRIEELINYFDYDYAAPEGDAAFAVWSELSRAPWHDEHLLLRIGIQAARVEVGDMPPANLVFLIDVSGSMNEPDKLPLVRESFPLLVQQMRPQDRIAIVVYAGAAGLVLPSTPGSERADILAAIERLRAGGSTAGGAGLRLAYAVARENFIEGGNNRVILATDGDFNVGESSDDAMTRLIEQERASGVFLSVLGFGTGNLQDAKMEAIADNGNGNYFYVDDLREARKVFVQEIAGTLVTVAKDVKLQIEFNPQRVAAYRLIGYENRALEAYEFDDDSIDSGDIGAGHSVTALYEIVPVEADSDIAIRAVADLRYQQLAPSAAAASDEIALVRIRHKDPDGDTSRLLEAPIRSGISRPSADTRFASAVAAFGMLLRESEFRGEADAELVLDLARAARGPDEHGHRAEFIELVERFETLRKDVAHAQD